MRHNKSVQLKTKLGSKLLAIYLNNRVNNHYGQVHSLFTDESWLDQQGGSRSDVYIYMGKVMRDYIIGLQKMK